MSGFSRPNCYISATRWRRTKRFTSNMGSPSWRRAGVKPGEHPCWISPSDHPTGIGRKDHPPTRRNRQPERYGHDPVRAPEGVADYCSRVCCTNTMKNAIRLKLFNPDCNVTVLYRNIVTYGFREEYYTEARRRAWFSCAIPMKNRRSVFR